MIITLLDRIFGAAANALNIPVDQVSIALTLVLMIPLSYGFHIITNKTLRHVYSIVLGLIFQYGVYREGMYHVLGQTVISYLIVYFMQRKAAKAVCFETFIFLSIYQIYRQITDYGGWTLDVSTILMMNTCKFQGFAWDFQDGGKKEEELSEDQKKYRIKELPSFFEYLSFAYYFPSAIIGPNYEYNDYKAFIEGTDKFSSVPNPIFECLRQLLLGVIFIASTVFLLPKFPMKYVITEEYYNSSLLFKFYFFNISMTLCRIRYYAAWCLTQASIVGSGFAYDGIDNEKNHKWDGVLTANPALELMYNPYTKIELWNASAQLWLKNHVYLRFYSEKEIKSSARKANAAQYGTYLVSAMWHGFYPGYYIAFVHWSMCSMLAKFCYKASLKYPNFNYENNLYKLFRFLIPNICMNYFGFPFQLLDLQSTWTFFSNTYFSVVIFIYLVLGFFYITKFGQPPKKTQTPKTHRTD